jgi:hypothetical protein
MPTVQDFREYIRYTKAKAADQGLQEVELNAEGIHQSIAANSIGFRDVELCREAMREEADEDDEILVPANGKATNLTIRYKLLR